jgi:branched-chain amino acid transport system substrate-binding protein
MNRNTARRCIVVSMFALLAAIAVGSASAKGTSTKFTIGAITGLTGAESSFGAPWSQGVQMAAAKLSASNVKVVIADSQSTATQAVNAAKKLIDVDKAKIVICGCYSGTFFPVQSYAASRGVLVVNAGSSSPQVRTLKGSVVSVLSLDDTVAKGLADWAIQRGYRKAAFVVGNDAYSTGVKQYVGAEFTKRGGTIVATTVVQAQQPDYRPEMTTVAQAKPDVIFSTSFSNDAQLQFKQGVELGITAPWFELYPTVSGLDSYEPAFGKLFGLEIGWLSTAAKTWRADYQKRFKKPATVPWPAISYDATMLSGKAGMSNASTAASLQSAFVRSAATYAGPSGKMVFDKNRTRINEPFQKLALVSPGKFVPSK